MADLLPIFKQARWCQGSHSAHSRHHRYILKYANYHYRVLLLRLIRSIKNVFLPCVSFIDINNIPQTQRWDTGVEKPFLWKQNECKCEFTAGLMVMNPSNVSRRHSNFKHNSSNCCFQTYRMKKIHILLNTFYTLKTVTNWRLTLKPPCIPFPPLLSPYWVGTYNQLQPQRHRF